MKSFISLIALALVSQSIASPTLKVGDKYGDLVSGLLKFCRKELAEHKPLLLPNLGPQTVSGREIELTIDQTDVTLSNAENFVVTEFTTDPQNGRAVFRLKFPQFAQSGTYSLSGTASRKQISGTGQFSANSKNFDIKIFLTFVAPETSLQIEALTIGYSMEKVNLNMTGLAVDWLNPAEVEQFIANDLSSVWFDLYRESFFNVEDRINKLMAGKSLDEIVAWIEQQSQ